MSSLLADPFVSKVDTSSFARDVSTDRFGLFLLSGDAGDTPSLSGDAEPLLLLLPVASPSLLWLSLLSSDTTGGALPLLPPLWLRLLSATAARWLLLLYRRRLLL